MKRLCSTRTTHSGGGFRIPYFYALVGERIQAASQRDLERRIFSTGLRSFEMIRRRGHLESKTRELLGGSLSVARSIVRWAKLWAKLPLHGLLHRRRSSVWTTVALGAGPDPRRRQPFGGGSTLGRNFKVSGCVIPPIRARWKRSFRISSRSP